MRALWVAMLSVTTAATGAANELERSVAAMAEVGAAWSPSFSPDGKQLAFVSDLPGIPQVWVADVRGGWPKAVTRLEDQVSSVTWSPDGEWLAFQLAPGGGMNSQVYLVRPAGTDLLRLTDGGKENNWLGDWSHDGSLPDARLQPRLAAGHGLLHLRPRVRLARQDRFEPRDRQNFRSQQGMGDWPRSGECEVVVTPDVYLRSLETGDESLLTPHEGPTTYGGGRFSPDGRTVYLASNTGRDRVAFSRVRLSAAGTPGAEEVVAGRDDADLQRLHHHGRWARGQALGLERRGTQRADVPGPSDAERREEQASARRADRRTHLQSRWADHRDDPLRIARSERHLDSGAGRAAPAHLQRPRRRRPGTAPRAGARDLPGP